jgi:hypothetical protein
MTTYRINAPDGSSWEVTAPDGATEDAVMNYAKAQWAHSMRNKPAPKKFDPTEDMTFGERMLAGAGKAFVDVGRGAGQMLGLVDQASIDEAKKLDAPLMETGAGLAGNIGANMLTAVLPGTNTVKGAAALGGVLSALQPTSTGESRMEKAATGAALGLGGALAAKGVGKAVQYAKGRMASLADKVQAKAAADAAAETASARAYAGNAAQNAYKQMQVLASKAEQGALSADEAVVWKSLQEEYLRKAQEKLIPAATAKEISSKAFKEAIDTEAERAAELAAHRLSGKEAANQVMARLKRYGPAAIGGAIGGTIFGGPGAVAGIPIGLYLRPMLHATMRMARNPAVQYQMLRPVANSGLLADMANPRIMGLLGPSIYAAQE